MDTIRSFFSEDLNQGAFWNILSVGVLSVGGILTITFVSFRGQEALGVFNQVYAIYIVLSQFGTGGIQHSTMNYISQYYQDAQKSLEVLFAALVLVVISTSMIAIGTWYAADIVGDILQSTGVAFGLRLVAPGLVLFAINKVLLKVINAYSAMRAFALFRSLRYVLLSATIILIIITGFPSDFLALSLTITEAILLVGMAFFVFGSLVRIHIPMQFKEWTTRHLNYGMRGMFSGILLNLNTRIDVLVLGYFTTDATVGLYSFAAAFAEGMSQIPQALRWSLDPQLGRLLSQNDIQGVEKLSRSSRRTFRLIFAALGILAGVVYPIMLIVLEGRLNVISWSLFAIMLFGIVVSSGYSPFAGLLLQGGRPGTYTLMIFALVLGDVLLSIIFVPILGVWGAAAVTALTYMLEALYIFLLARIVLKVNL